MEPVYDILCVFLYFNPLSEKGSTLKGMTLLFSLILINFIDSLFINSTQPYNYFCKHSENPDQTVQSGPYPSLLTHALKTMFCLIQCIYRKVM